MQQQFGQLVLRYLIFVGIPYFLARRLEKFLINRLDPETKARLNEELKRFPEEEVQKFPHIEGISENTKTALDQKGGTDPISVWFTKVFILDFGIKVAILGGISSTIWSSIADSSVQNILKYAAPILASPGVKFKTFYNKLRGLDESYNQDIKAILLDKNLSILEKSELLKIKIEQTLKNLKGVKRRKFIIFIMATLLFFFGGGAFIEPGNVAVFGSLMERLRALLGLDSEKDIKDALIEVYFEYNAPLPKELVESVKNLK